MAEAGGNHHAFLQVMGMWLQTTFVAKAEVRFFGEHTLTAQDVQFRANEMAGEDRELATERCGRLAGNGRNRRSLNALA